MSNYTTQTASLKATSIDTRLLDAKHIETKKLFINGIDIDQKLKQAAIASRGSMMEISFTNGVAQSCTILVKDGKNLQKNNEEIICNCIIQNQDYDYGAGEKKYLCIFDTDEEGYPTLPFFTIETTVNKIIFVNEFQFEQMKLKESCLEGFTIFELGEADDNLEEIYNGIFYNGTIYILYQNNSLISYIDDDSSSTYSLRKTNPFDNIREKIEQMRQQKLDNSAE